MGSLFSFLWEWGVEVLLTSYTRFVMKSQLEGQILSTTQVFNQNTVCKDFLACPENVVWM